MGLRDLITSDVVSLALDTNQFAESVTYFPKGDASRTVIIQVIDDKDQLFENPNTGFNEIVEQIWIRTMRDPAHAKGGIAAPSHGDRIVRDITVEPDAREYLYANEIIYRTTDWWDLLFERRKLSIEGVAR